MCVPVIYFFMSFIFIGISTIYLLGFVFVSVFSFKILSRYLFLFLFFVLERAADSAFLFQICKTVEFATHDNGKEGYGRLCDCVFGGSIIISPCSFEHCLRLACVFVCARFSILFMCIIFLYFLSSYLQHARIIIFKTSSNKSLKCSNLYLFCYLHAVSTCMQL